MQTPTPEGYPVARAILACILMSIPPVAPEVAEAGPQDLVDPGEGLDEPGLD